MTEQLDFLEVLSRVCERKGWALMLQLEECPGGFLTPGESRLTTLDVIAPNHRFAERRRQLVAGELLARATVGDPSHLQAAGEACTSALARLIDQEAA